MRALALLLIAVVALAPISTSESRLTPVSRAQLCVTEGTVDALAGNRLAVGVPKMRAYLLAATQPSVEAQFTYLGSTRNEARLGSGELRRQFGLKLRAQDACNLVYAMWRIEPESKLVVSVKTNPGQHSSAACGNRGYRNIKPARSTPVPVLRPGQSHTLHAEMNGEHLRVFADGAVVWEGSVGADALAFDGPVGMRSDNAKLELELLVGGSRKPPAGLGTGCRTGPGESE